MHFGGQDTQNWRSVNRAGKLRPALQLHGLDVDAREVANA